MRAHLWMWLKPDEVPGYRRRQKVASYPQRRGIIMAFEHGSGAWDQAVADAAALGDANQGIRPSGTGLPGPPPGFGLPQEGSPAAVGSTGDATQQVQQESSGDEEMTNVSHKRGRGAEGGMQPRPTRSASTRVPRQELGQQAPEAQPEGS